MKFPTRKDLTGSKNHQAKLTEAQVVEIRSLLDNGKYKLRVLADRYQVSIASIWRIKHRENWRNI